MAALSFAFITLMYAVNLSPLINANRDGVTLQDADDFRRLLHYSDVREMWRTGGRHIAHHIAHHHDYMIREYGVVGFHKWHCEAAKCRDAWDILDNICHPTICKSPEYTMWQLRVLRGIIGAEAYDARMMPPPCPGWMFTQD